MSKGGGDDMDLGAGPGLVIVDTQPEYEVDHILHKRGTGN